MIKKLYELLHSILIQHKYLHFFATGVSGVALNLFITWYFTTFVFGLSGYFKAYIIGMSFNLVYNFVLHTIVTFQTKTRHIARLAIFVLYSLVLTAINATVVKYVTEYVGEKYYLIVIAATILAFSTVTFVLFKFFLFREPVVEEVK